MVGTSLALRDSTNRPKPRDTSRRIIRVALASAVTVLCLLLCSGTVLNAKKKVPVSRTVKGIVSDEADNGLTGASVEMKDLQSGKTVAIYTEEGGQYHFSDLNPMHDYELRAIYGSATSEPRKLSSLDTRNTIVINFKVSSPKP